MKPTSARSTVLGEQRVNRNREAGEASLGERGLSGKTQPQSSWGFPGIFPMDPQPVFTTSSHPQSVALVAENSPTSV